MKLLVSIGVVVVGVFGALFAGSGGIGGTADTSSGAGTLQSQPTIEVLASSVARLPELSITPEIVPVVLRDFVRSDVGAVTLDLRVGAGPFLAAAVPMNHSVHFDDSDREHPNIIRERLDVFEVDLSTLALFPQDVITYTVTVHSASALTPWGQITGTGTTLLLDSESQDPCIETCVSAFLSELEVSRDESGKVTLGSSVGCEELKTALANLRACLSECEPPVTEITLRTITCTLGEEQLSVRIEVKPNNATGSGQPSIVSSSADVVVAVGGNSGTGSSAQGGSGSATNTKSGGASIAFGGKGGAASGGGKGGAAQASSSHSSAGDAIAVGGNGGNGATSGGDGGSGTGKTKNTDATGFGQGGDGGDPVDDEATGGKGGNGTGQRASNVATGLGSGQPDNPSSPGDGEHGEGGWGRNTPAGATTHNGANLTNT